METPIEALSIEAASTLAVVALSNEPLLYVSADLSIILASQSFCGAFQIVLADIVGRPLAEMGSGEWASPQIGSLLKATASGIAQLEAYEIELVREDKPTLNLLLNARKIETSGPARLLLAITDITHARADARKMETLVREKELLMQEVQHRVANSLQIIASVLMQGARQVQSEEARSHLKSAHHRVLSIASVQRQLAQTSANDITLGPYLTQLCESLGASMISDPKSLSIIVKIDNSVVTANASVSIGLIVTELVIYALKHAFPNGRRGVITIEYNSNGRNWKLSVRDDGVGMPEAGGPAQAGLGSGIVEALARQLRGQISMKSGAPGTVVSLEGGGTAETGFAPLGAR